MAKRRTTAGTKQISLEMDEKLLAEFSVFVESRGETKRVAIEMAIRRHMAYPPAAPVEPPLSPLPDSAKPRRKS